MVEPTATVVIPTHRRPESLARALAVVARQHAPGLRWDVVVVDNATPPTVGHLQTARVVHEPEPGASAARNRGIAEAGDSAIVVFLDDDAVPEPGWLAALTAPIVAGEADGTGGKVVLDPTVPRPTWLDEDGIGGFLTAFDLGATRDLRPGEFVITASAAFRTDLLRDVGGFDTAVGPTGARHLVNDDVLLCKRLMQRGARLRYVADAVAIHELPAERLRPRFLLERAWLQGRSDWLTDDVASEGRFGGASQALKWWRHETAARLRERPWRRDVAFHAACDAVRTAGALTQAASFVAARYTSRRRA